MCDEHGAAEVEALGRPPASADLLAQHAPALLHEAQVGLFVLDVVDQRILYANPYFAELVGRSPEELLTIPVLDMVEPEYRDLVAERLRERIAGKPVAPYTVIGRRKDGTNFDAHIAGRRLEVDGRLTLVVTITDLSDYNRVLRQTQRIQAQKEAAEAAAEAKSRFLAAVNHDLRQPLHAVELISTALRRNLVHPAALLLCDRIDQATTSMTALLDSLLDVYRLDSGALHPNVRTFPAGDLLRDLGSEFGPVARERGLRLRVTHTAKTVVSDPAILRRILANLVNNALRYTQEGSVQIVCRRDVSGVRIEVRDSGPGIARDEHQRIFDEFTRGASSADGTPGTGLGLNIVSRMASALQAPVTLRSEPGRGSVFAITLPRGPDVATHDSGQPSEPAASAAIPQFSETG